MKPKIVAVLIAGLILSVQSCKKEKNATSIAAIEEKEYTPKTFDSTKFDAKIDSLIALMTLEEKIGMLHGNSMFATGGVERLGIPELKMADGPLGVREEISRDSWASAGSVQTVS